MSSEKTIFICRSATVRDNWIQNHHRSGVGKASVCMPPDFLQVCSGGLLVLYTFSSPKSFFKLGLNFMINVFYKVGREISMENEFIELISRALKKISFMAKEDISLSLPQPRFS